MLPVFITPDKDELFNSHMYRLAKANGLSMQNFVGRGLYNESDCRKVSHYHWNNDGWGLFPPFFQMFPVDKREYIQNHSIFPFLALFLSEHRQGIVADWLFSDNPVKKCPQLIPEFLYCPKCKQEEMDTYGHYYLHRIHHLPGVTVCHKHGIPLVTLENNIPLAFKVDDVDYARFAADLLFSGLHTNINEIQKVTLEHTHDIPATLQNGFYSSKYDKIPDIIRCLLHTFSNVKNLASYLKPCEINMSAPVLKRRKNIPFEHHVSNLVGNEYTIIGEYKGQNHPIEIRHEKCGYVQTYLPKHFLNGARCSHCTKIVSPGIFPSVVNYMTNGQYKVIHSVSHNLYEIAEAEGATIEISAPRFFQEILRPTPSDILPVPVKQLRTDWNIWEAERPKRISTKDLYARICSLYNHDDIIFMEDLRTNFPDDFYKALKSGVKTLIRNGKLYRVETGIYTLSPIKLTPKELITQKYLVRNGKRIGIYDSKSLAYEMGMAKEPPDKLYIMTNKEAMTHGRNRIINGLPVHIRGNELLITEENYKFIMVLEAIKYNFHYDAGYNYRIPQFICEHDLHMKGFLSLLPFYSENVKKTLINIWRAL